MEAKRATILGLSISTRILGYAVVRDHELLAWGVKSFAGAWSGAKQQAIIGFCKKMLHDYGVSGIALKHQHPSRMSCGMGIVCNKLTALVAVLGITLCSLTIREIKVFCSGTDKGKRDVVEAYAKEQYPEYFVNLHTNSEYMKRYYGKLFEAVVCALMADDKEE